MILYPAIDIREGQAVRLLRGDFSQQSVYDSDPVEAARRWVAAGARFLHVVDLDGARAGKPLNLAAIERICAAVEVPLQVGGGLRTAEAVAAAIGAGAERVVLGTAALGDPELLNACLRTHGGRVVAGVDARAGRVAVQGWTESGELDAALAVARLSEQGVGRFVFTAIDVDGTLAGPDLEQLRLVAAATEAEVIYSGGVGALDDLRALVEAGVPNLGGVIVGKALYERRFTIAAAEAALAG